MQYEPNGDPARIFTEEDAPIPGQIQLEIFVEIFSVMGADLTKNTTWISNCHHVRGDILGDHGACADHAVVADGDAGHDLNARADYTHTAVPAGGG